MADPLIHPLDIRQCHYDVCVVGLGPVGAVAAQLLAREGLSVLAVDPMRTPYDIPRALGIDHESLRLLQKIGVADAMGPILGEYRVSEYRAADGSILRRIVPAPEPFPLSWPPYNTFLQPEFERILRTAFSSWDNLDVALGTRCEAISQEADRVSLSLESDDGARSMAKASYAIGCDGSWSPVRQAMGIELEDLAFDEPWLVVDVLVNEEAKLPETTVQYCDPARPASFIHGPGALRRWEIMLLPGEDPTEMVRPASVWRLLEPWLTPNQGVIWRSATYRFHALVARTLALGRVFIAGDAAHQTPPFMAQGLNQGLRDVGNLAWKLGEVVRHGAQPNLLDSYDAERRPNAKAVIQLTKEFGSVICERDRRAAAARDARMKEEMRAGRGEIVRQDLLPPLADGFLARGRDGSIVPGAGKILPQPRIVANGCVGRMDDVFPSRFLLLVANAGEGSEHWLDEASRLGVRVAALKGSKGEHIVDPTGLLGRWLKEHGAEAALARPDSVVFGTVERTADIRALLQSLAEQLYGKHTCAVRV